MHGLSELFFSFITGLAISKFLTGNDIFIFNSNLKIQTIIYFLIIAIFSRYFFGAISIKYSSKVVFAQWKLIIEKFYFVVRNGKVGLNQVSKLTSLIQHDCMVAFNGFYNNSFLLMADVLLLILGIIVLSIINFQATLYSILLSFILGLSYFRYFSNLNKESGKHKIR